MDTPLVQRDCLLINEAARAGGQITDVLEAAAQDTREVKALETEGRTAMSLYTLVIYIILAVLLLVIAILYASFISPFLKATQAAAGSTLSGVSLKPIDPNQFRSFYFITALVQAIGNGFMAGLIESGQALSGLRHAFLMLLTTYAAFAFFLP